MLYAKRTTGERGDEAARLQGARRSRCGEAYALIWLDGGAVVLFVVRKKENMNILQKSYIKICIYNFFVVCLQCEIKRMSNQLKKK